MYLAASFPPIQGSAPGRSFRSSARRSAMGLSASSERVQVALGVSPPLACRFAASCSSVLRMTRVGSGVLSRRRLLLGATDRPSSCRLAFVATLLPLDSLAPTASRKKTAVAGLLT